MEKEQKLSESIMLTPGWSSSKKISLIPSPYPAVVAKDDVEGENNSYIIYLLLKMYNALMHAIVIEVCKKAVCIVDTIMMVIAMGISFH